MPRLDRVVQFNEGGEFLNLFETQNGRLVARVRSTHGRPVKRIGSNEYEQPVRHLPVLFADGELIFLDLIDGQVTQGAAPPGEIFENFVAASPQENRVLVQTVSGKLLLFENGIAAPVAVTELPETNAQSPISLTLGRFAAVSASKQQVLFFGKDGSEQTNHYDVKANIDAIVSVGARSIIAAMEGGSTRLISYGLEQDVESLGQRFPVINTARLPNMGLYAIGTSNGSFLVGHGDSRAILREGRVGKAGIIAVTFDQAGRSVEFMNGDGERINVEIMAPRQKWSWSVSDFSVLDGAREVDTCRLIAASC